MNLLENPLYMEDVKLVAELPLPWERLQDSSVTISGATGLIGSFLTDVIMYRNRTQDMNCKVLALSRNKERAWQRFAAWDDEKRLRIISWDICQPLALDEAETADYVLHLASHTHPAAYATDPVGTITVNVIGLKNMLDFAAKYHAKRIAFASSNEIYGENRGDVEFFKEDYCGYIDCNALRAGYPESKRCGEALCQAYHAQIGLDVVIPRLTRSYGPTMMMSDTKAISQFIRKALSGEDIVLKSAGTQYFSYTYVADAVSGLLTVLLRGKTGEAYNIADTASDIKLKDLAWLIARFAGRKVVFETPDAVESAGYSKATKARLDSAKLQALGWRANYTLERGIEKTIRVLTT